MGWFTGVKNFLWRGAEEGDTDQQEAHQKTADRGASSSAYPSTSTPAGGNSRRRATAVGQNEPVIRDPAHGASGGVQGLSWYVARQRQDSDGEIAEEFWIESAPARAGGPWTLKMQVSSRPRRLFILKAEHGNVILCKL